MERLGTCRRCGRCWSRAAAERLFSAARVCPAAFAAPFVSTARGGQIHFISAASKYTNADETAGLAVAGDPPNSKDPESVSGGPDQAIV